MEDFEAVEFFFQVAVLAFWPVRGDVSTNNQVTGGKANR